MEISLAGRRAIITGGSRGLGHQMMLTFAAAGADVAILARDPDALKAAEQEGQALGHGRVKAFVCDVSRASDIEFAYKAIVAEFGWVDILVNNAGTSRTSRFEDISDEQWQTDLDGKLMAAIRLVRRVLPGMKERRWGRIINVLNTGAKAGRTNRGPTDVTRAAGLALTKILAGECAPHNVLVNALLVGLIVSDQHLRRRTVQAPNTPVADYLRDIGAAVPMGRMGQPEEFANIACFLASDAASYIAGTAINVDGGLSPLP